jgi:Leucine-rich repeat (LRR) protein
MKNLENLNMDGNSIRFIDNLHKLDKLKVLKLGNNQIYKI